MFQIIWKRDEDIPYEKCFESLKECASNPLKKSPGHLEMAFEDIPYKKSVTSLRT